MSWQSLQLRRIFRVVNGGTPPGDEAYWNGDVPWATPIDVGAANQGYLDSTQRTLTREGLAAGSKMVPANSIIVSTRAPIGYIAQTRRAMAFNQGCRGLIPSVDVDVRYFRYQLASLADEMASRGAGSTFQEVSSNALAEIPVIHPHIDEQRRIADFLDGETARVDRVIAARRSQLLLLDERRRAALTACVTHDGVDRYIDSLVGATSPDWTLTTIRRVTSGVNVGVVVNPSTYFVDEGVPFIHGFNVRSGWIDRHGMKFMSPASNARLFRSRAQCGDVLVVRAGAPGRAAAVPRDLDGANCASVLILRRSDAIIPNFLAAFFNAAPGQGQVGFSQYGAAQEVISAAQIAGFSIAVPSIPEQRRRVAQLDERLHHNRELERRLSQQLSLLSERRQALITAAVTGHLDVTTARGAHLS